MNKRTSLTTRAAKTPVYPDVMGGITQGQRLNVDVLQIAVAVRPAAINAGKPFEAVILVQNASNIDVDAVTRIVVPEADSAGHKGRFSTKQTAPLRIGLRPGEVGYATVPVLSAHNTTPGAGYTLQIDLLVEEKARGAVRIREANGGIPFVLDELPEDRWESITAMQKLSYSTVTTGKVTINRASLTVPFEILPPAVSGLPQELKPSYTSLWTDADFPDEFEIIEQTKAMTAVILPQLNHNNVFFPLLKATQSHFEGAQFRLWAGEAIAITKLLTLLLEIGGSHPDATGGANHPHWFLKLCRMLVRNPRVAHDLNQLVSELLYPELIYDATIFGFAMLATVTKDQFGSTEEISEYAHYISAAVTREKSIDFSHVYLPLVVAGVVANARVAMPQEQIRETLHLMATACEKRTNLQDEDNKFVFDLTHDLIERALEQA